MKSANGSPHSKRAEHTRKFTDRDVQEIRDRDAAREPLEASSALSQAPQTTEAKPPRPTRMLKRKHRGRGCLNFLLFLLLAFIMIIAAFYTYDFLFRPTPIEELPTSQQEAEARTRAEENIHLLLIGVDQEEEGWPRSDTMVYAVLRPVDKEVALLSLPRDSLVNIPGYGQDKLNAAYSVGGSDLLKETVENLLENPVDHSMAIDFDAFARIINAMGGVTIDVPEDMYYEDPYQDLLIDLKAGRQRLNGEEALGFVRWRGDGQGDLGRIERQQVFLQAVGRKARHLWPWQAVRTALVVQREVETDLDFWDMARLTFVMIGMGREDIHSYQLAADGQYINDVSYALLDPTDVATTVRAMEYGLAPDQGGAYA